jgi:hypothetical protein
LLSESRHHTDAREIYLASAGCSCCLRVLFCINRLLLIKCLRNNFGRSRLLLLFESLVFISRLLLMPNEIYLARAGCSCCLRVIFS